MSRITFSVPDNGMRRTLAQADQVAQEINEGGGNAVVKNDPANGGTWNVHVPDEQEG